MGQKYPTKQISAELKRGRSATVMKAHLLRISLRLKPKRGSRPADVSLTPGPGRDGSADLEPRQGEPWMTPRERKDLPWIVAAFAVVMVVIFVGASWRGGGDQPFQSQNLRIDSNSALSR